MFYKSKTTLFLTVLTLATQSHAGCEPCNYFFPSQPKDLAEKSVAVRQQAESEADKSVKDMTAKYKNCSARNHKLELANREKLLGSFKACSDRNKKFQEATDGMYTPGEYTQYSEECVASLRKVMDSFAKPEDCNSILNSMMAGLEGGSLAKLQAASIKSTSTTVKLTPEEVIVAALGEAELAKFKEALRTANESKTQTQAPEEAPAGEDSRPDKD